MSLMRAIGLMSGTSMDAIDVALVETDGLDAIILGATRAYPYSEPDRALLRRAITDAVGVSDRTARPGALAEAEAMITTRHAQAVEAFLAAEAIERETIDIVGFHGQTVLHRPERHLTVQIGDGAMLAEKLGLAVAYDFRATDAASGGQGAPLVPIFHHALAAAAGFREAVLTINIGGVANVSFIVPGKPPIACDAGPGNALIDDLMWNRRGVALDRDGAVAARGKVDAKALTALLSHEYFAKPPPKSLDRNEFSAQPVAHLSTEDAAATLTAFTAEAIFRALGLMPAQDHDDFGSNRSKVMNVIDSKSSERDAGGKPGSTFPHPAPSALAIVCGGGARNQTLMRELARRLPCKVVSAETFGWSIDAMEAQAFAYLAVRTLQGLPITFPTTTGVAKPLPGGILAEPKGSPRAVRPAADAE